LKYEIKNKKNFYKKKNHKQKLEIKRIRTEVETQTTKRTKCWRRKKKEKK
jgi:hypothetical protein